MKCIRYILLASFLFPFCRFFSQNNITSVPLNKYLEFARSSAEWTWEHYDSLETAWRKSIDPENIFGYRPPGRFLEMATIYATLYQVEGNKEYAGRALEALLRYGSYKNEYPSAAAQRRYDYAAGVPALPDFFTTMRYIRPFVIIKEKGFLTPEQQQEMEEVIAQSVNYTLLSQEWGAMNRAMLRAETLAWAVKALPDHPDAK